MKKYRNIVLAIALTCGGGSMMGQEELTKQIVVAKDYVPTEQKATKLNNLPEVSKVEVTSTTLKYSDWAVPTNVNPMLSPLMPLGYYNTPQYSTKRGYLEFGMGSFLNINANAGYKILSDDVNTLNVWLQHNSTWGGLNNTPNSWVARTMSSTPPIKIEQLSEQKYMNDILGIDYSRKIGGNILSANAFYHFSRFNYFGATPYHYANDIMQNINEFKLALAYGTAPKDEGLQYKIGLAYDHFGYDEGLKENNFILNGDISTQMGETSRVGADLKVDYLYYSSLLSANELADKSYGIVSLSPYYKVQNEKLNLKLGLNIDVSFNDGTIFRFSPNVNFDYKISNKVIFYSDITGGKKQNKFAEITTINPYLLPISTIGNSYTPFDFIAGLKLGSFSGFTAKVWGGYAMVTNQQLPWSSAFLIEPDTEIASLPYSLHSQYTQFEGVDMSGFQLGVELAYKYKNFAELKTKFAYSPQDYEKGYIFSYDRPEYTIGVDLTVNPIEKLKIIASYEFAGNRNMYSRLVSYIDTPVGKVESVNVLENSLGNMNQLRLHASYKINDTFGAFVQANNLLNKKWDTFLFMGAQKINFMAGVNVQF